MFRFNPSNLNKLAQVKAEANQQSQPNQQQGQSPPSQWQSNRDHMLRQEAAGKATTAMSEWLQGWREKGSPDTQAGMRMDSPVAGTPFNPAPVVEPTDGGGFGPEGGGGMPNDPNDQYKQLLAAGCFPPDAAEAVIQGPEAAQAALNNQLGFGHQQAQTQPMGQPVPMGPQGNPGGNVQQPQQPPQGNPMAMFNALAGVTNAVRAEPGRQYHQQQQQQQQQQQYQSGYNPGSAVPANNSPSWSPVQNSAAAGPPGHGGGNPGFSGMLTNTDGTMAALKALMQGAKRR